MVFFFSSSSLSLEIKKTIHVLIEKLNGTKNVINYLKQDTTTIEPYTMIFFAMAQYSLFFFRIFSRILDYLEEAKKKFLFSILTLGVKWSCCAGNSRVSNLFLFFSFDYLWLFACVFHFCSRFMGLFESLWPFHCSALQTQRISVKRNRFLFIGNVCIWKSTGDVAIKELAVPFEKGRKRKRNKMCKQWLNNNKINIEKPKVNDE